jgi:cold shock CspA family protein
MRSRRAYANEPKSWNGSAIESHHATSSLSASTRVAFKAICSGFALNVPGREIAVGRDPAAHHAHEDVYVAIRDAFDATRRLLEDYARERRGDVKLHAVPDHGRVTRLLPEQNCGFILGADGSEIYFHRNSVANGGFDELAVGDEVRFVAQHAESAQGPQASTVVPIGKHHLPPAEAVRA